MNRYSMLWGTTDSGEYRLMWNSRKLAEYLESIGATDPSKAADTAQNILRSFGDYPEYAEQPVDDKPVSVHYAPMHLYKLPEFPSSMKPFCAWSVTGAENRPGGRNSTYSHTVIFPYELMLGSDKSRNYLDILFGTKVLDWKDIKAFREKVKLPAFDADPNKVSVDFTDLKLAIFSAATIIEAKGEKNLLIRLEKNCSFNRRAFALLSQIYSLLPPKLATETGFATYHTVADIVGISSKNSICVFVLPASADLKQLAGGKNVVIDLTENDGSINLQQSPLTETLLQWSRLSWDRRCAAYESIFESDPAYLESSTFIRKSKELFDNIREYEEWISSAKGGTIQSLQDICTFFIQHKEWKQIPWYKEQFRQALPKLLPKGERISTLLDDAVTNYQFAKSAEEKKTAGELYHIGSQFGEIEIQDLCNRIAARQKEESTAEFLPQLEAERKHTEDAEARHVEELSAEKTAHEKERAELVSVYEGKLQKAETLHAAELTAKKEAFEQELTKQKQSAEEEKKLACKDLEERLKKARIIYQEQKEKIDSADARYAELESRLRKEETDHEKTKRKVTSVEDELKEVKRDANDLEYQLDRLGRWPRFLTNLPWFAVLVIAVLIGALIVGGVWGVMTFAGKQENATETQSISETLEPSETQTEATEIPTEATEMTEAPTEAIEMQIPTPDFVYTDWTDPETVRQLQLAVPEILTVQTGEEVQKLCPAVMEGYTVQAFLSTDEIALTPPTEGEEQMLNARNYALLLLKDENTENADLTKLDVPGLVMQWNDQVLLSHGDDRMMNAAVCTIQTVTGASDTPEESEPIDNGSSAPKGTEDATAKGFKMFWILDDDDVLNIGEAFTAITADTDWWRNMSGWSRDSEDLLQGQEKLNSIRIPILTISLVDNDYYLYDYRDDPQKVQVFVENNEDHKTETFGNFVLIDANEVLPDE